MEQFKRFSLCVGFFITVSSVIAGYSCMNAVKSFAAWDAGLVLQSRYRLDILHRLQVPQGIGGCLNNHWSGYKDNR